MPAASPIKNTTVTLPTSEFLRLKREAQAYRNLATKVYELPLKDPVDEVVADFRNTDAYTTEFLDDLASGLRKSSYAARYGNRTAAARS